MRRCRASTRRPASPDIAEEAAASCARHPGRASTGAGDLSGTVTRLPAPCGCLASGLVLDPEARAMQHAHESRLRWSPGRFPREVLVF